MASDLTLNTTNGAIKLVPQDGSGTATVSVPRTGFGVLASGQVKGDGGSASGSNVTLASIAINFTGMEGKTLVIFGSTAISEISNTSNTAILGVKLNSNLIAAQRQGIGAYSVVTWNYNTISAISVQGVYTIQASDATTGTISLVGGIDAGAFYYGDQGDYTYYDGYNAGYILNYYVI